MATFRKRNNSWRVEIYKNGIRKSATFDTKAQAKAWAAKLESNIDTDQIESPAEHQKTVADAFERYANEVSVGKKGARYERIKLNAFLRDHLASIKISDLTPADIANWRDSRLKKVAGSSVNRELNLISSVLVTAKREWGWINSNPVSEIRRPKNPRPRERRISEYEIQQILDALDYNDVVNSKSSLLAVYFLLGIETAMRLGELCKLTQADIDLKNRFVTLNDTKNGEKRHVPLTLKAVELFKKVIDSELTLDPGVASTLFRRAARFAQIENLTFHDTRHEGLTRLARKLDVLDLARMVGHRDPRSLMIYYNPTPSEIAARLD